MAINVTVEFIRPDTVCVQAKVYDDDDALADPTSIVCSSVDPDGTTQDDEVAMTKASTGIYNYYIYMDSTSVLGDWKGLVQTADGTGATTKYTSETFGFKLKRFS